MVPGAMALDMVTSGSFIPFEKPSGEMMSRVLRTGPDRLALDIISPEGYLLLRTTRR